MDRYRVTAPYVLAKAMTPDGLQVRGIYKDALVPEGVSAEWVERHLRKKMIAPIEAEPAADAVPAPAAAEAPGQEALPPPPAAPPTDPDVPEPPTTSSDVPEPPPTTGPGSGQSAWVDYAVARGMDRGEAVAMRRDDLIAALRED